MPCKPLCYAECAIFSDSRPYVTGKALARRIGCVTILRPCREGGARRLDVFRR